MKTTNNPHFGGIMPHRYEYPGRGLAPRCVYCGKLSPDRLLETPAKMAKAVTQGASPALLVARLKLSPEDLRKRHDSHDKAASTLYIKHCKRPCDAKLYALLDAHRVLRDTFGSAFVSETGYSIQEC